MTHFSIFPQSSLLNLLFLTVLLSKASLAASSSISFCEIATSTGGSCLILDKDSPDFKTLFPNTVLNILLNSLQPTITAVTPLQVPQGSTVDLFITAPKAHFNSTSLANLSLSGGIIVNAGKAVLSPIQLIANVSVPVTTPVGFYDITAKTHLEDNRIETVSGLQLLQVIPSSLQPIILSVTPLVVSRNTESTRLVIYGQNTHFTDQSLLDFGDTGLTGVNPVIKSPTHMQVDLKVASTATVGFHKIKVKTVEEVAEDMQPLGLLQVFESNRPPALVYLQPAQGRQWETLSLNLLGQDTHFIQGETTVNFGAGIQALQTTVISPTELTVTVTLAKDALLGPRDVSVTTGAETAVFSNGFAVFSPATIDFTPKMGKIGEELTLTIQGDDQTQWVQGQIELRIATSQTIQEVDTGITVKSLEVQTAHLATAVIQIAKHATPGVRYLAIVSNHQAVMVPTNGKVFEVIIAGEARVKSLEPHEAVLGETKVVTLIGENTHFNAQSVVKWSGTGIQIKQSQVINDSEIQLTLMIDHNAQLGTQGVQVMTGTETANLANALTLLAPEQIELVVKKTSRYGQVTSDVAGIQCGEDCSHRYAKGTVIILTAKVDTTSQFVGWEPACGGQIKDAQITLTLTKDLICTAQFEVRQANLKIEKQGFGNVNDLLGIDCGERCQADYPLGTSVTLVATPEANNLFQSWQGECGQSNENTTTITLDAHKTCTAIFIPKSEPPLSDDETLMIETTKGRVIVTTTETLSCQGSCTYHYPRNTLITLEAKADEGYRFVQWKGDCSHSTERTMSISLTTAKACAADFEAITAKVGEEQPEYQLTVRWSGQGQLLSEPSGIVCVENTCSARYAKNTVVQLTAIPDFNFVFKAWRGDCTGEQSMKVLIIKETSCEAVFEERLTNEHRLQIILQGLGEVNSEPVGIHCTPDSQQSCIYTNPAAATVKLTALPGNNHEFTGWEGDCQEQEASLSVLVKGSKVCTARFEPVKRIEFVQSSMLVTEFGEVSTLKQRGHSIILPLHKTGDDRVTVNWQAIDGTAKVNEDYVMVSPPTLTETNGEASRGIEVFIIDDERPEADETFKITLSPLTGSTQLGTVKQIEVVIQDNDRTTACTLPLQPARQTLLLWKGEPKTVSLSGGSGQRYVEENFNHALVTVMPSFPATGGAELLLTPQDVGTTQVVVNDACGNKAVLEISIQERSLSSDQACSPDSQLAWQPAELSITLLIGEEPRIYWLTGGQGQRQLIHAPDAQLVNLEKIEFPETAGAQITLSPRQEEGTTTLVVGDCAGHQAVINLSVAKPENHEVCKALQPQQQHISLLTNSQPITLSFNGSQTDLDLTQLPHPMVVTLANLKTLSNHITQLVLTPREYGRTQLKLDNCAHQAAIVDIIVLKPNTLAYFCELDHRYDGLCAHPDETKSIDGNGMSLNTKGEPIDIPVHWQIRLVVQSQPLDAEVPIVSSAEELTVQVTTISEQLNHQTAELILLLEHQGEFYFPTVHDVIPDGANKVEEVQENKLDAPSSSSRDSSLLVMTWPRWNKELTDLKAVKFIDQLAAIHEETFSFHLLPDLSGEMTLYIGYRLEDGRLVFNGRRPVRFIGANSIALSSQGKYQDSRAYFQFQVHPGQIMTQIYPDPEHLHQNGELMIVAVYFSPEGQVRSFSRSSNEQWQPWDGQWNTLEIAQPHVFLTGYLTTELSLGSLSHMVGTLHLYLGYRQLDKDTIIFNGKAPIVLTLP